MIYSLKFILGQGGMATVHLAEDPKFHTEVAVKVLNKEFVHNENIRKRFLAEARNMFRMSHPNIVKVTDLIEEADTVAFVMEYIEGETLKDYLERKGKLSDDEIKTIFSQMLDAVGYVHEQNLVHRDIKPSNFMVDKQGKVKLMDFGIAKNTDATSAEYTQTGTGMQMGTPMYMSPEQITETKSVTAQSDIYSLGVVLWQMITGEKPYDVKILTSFQLQLKIVNDPLPNVNAQWDASIQKATSKVQSERFQSCLEFENSISKDKKQNFDAENALNSKILNTETVFESKTIKEKSIINLVQSKGSEKNYRPNEVKVNKKTKLWFYLFSLIIIVILIFNIFFKNSLSFIGSDENSEEDFNFNSSLMMNKEKTFINEIDSLNLGNLKVFPENLKFLYADCSNSVLFKSNKSVPVENSLEFSVTNGQSIKGENPGEVSLIPGANGIMTVFVKNRGQIIGEFSFDIKPVPKPKIQLLDSDNNEIDQTIVHPVSILKDIKIKARADSDFFKLMPNESNFHVSNADLILVRDGIPKKSMPLNSELDSFISEVRSGDNIHIRVNEVTRVNFRGNKIRSNYSNSNRLYDVLIKIK